MAERALTSETGTKALKRAKLDAKQQEAMAKLDLQNALVTESGRRFVWGLLVDAGVFRLSFTAGDSHVTAFNEGRRAQGNALFARIMRDCPESYHVMAQEARVLEEATKPKELDEQKPLTESEETES